MMRLLGLSLLLAAVPALAQSEQPIGADDPAKLHAALTAMGFVPDKLDMSGAPSTVITSNDSRYWVVLGGCTDKRGCKTLMIGSTFTDAAPDLDWINKQNESFDLLKVWRSDKGELSYAVQVPTAGLTRPQIRALVDGLNASSAQLAREAIDAKLVE